MTDIFDVKSRDVHLFSNGYGLSILTLYDEYEIAVLKRHPGALHSITRRYERWQILRNPKRWLPYFKYDDILRLDDLDIIPGLIETIKRFTDDQETGETKISTQKRAGTSRRRN